jgi:hypothetical protein
MTTVTVRSRVGPDGVLNVSVPLAAGDANQEVLVTVEPAAPKAAAMDRAAWLRFIERTAGSIPDPAFERPPQPELEQRDELP